MECVYIYTVCVHEKPHIARTRCVHRRRLIYYSILGTKVDCLNTSVMDKTHTKRGKFTGQHHNTTRTHCWHMRLPYIIHDSDINGALHIHSFIHVSVDSSQTVLEHHRPFHTHTCSKLPYSWIYRWELKAPDLLLKNVHCIHCNILIFKNAYFSMLYITEISACWIGLTEKQDWAH